MLKGISPILTPDLLVAMWRMGHGDTIVLCDGHFPAARLARGREHRLDPVGVIELAEAVLELLELDTYGGPPVALMAAEPGDVPDPEFRARLIDTVSRSSPSKAEVRLLSRQDFYKEAGEAQVLVATGETATYANVILRKGVVPSKGPSPGMRSPRGAGQ